MVKVIRATAVVKGADFHWEMVGTAAGEKTLHMPPPCEELNPTTYFCVTVTSGVIIDVMICSLQSVNLLFMLYLLTFAENYIYS